MALLVGELYALLTLEKRAFMKGLQEAETAAAASGKSIMGSLASAGKMIAVGLGLAAVAAVAVGVESIGAAQKFQAAMKMVQTQAGASTAEVAMLTKGILAMAGSVGTAPDVLAAGIYHIESAGIRGAQALDVLKTAALGAKMGNADLEAVTNALIAEINSGIPGVNNMSEAMGALNGIVGNGNMRMNDLALSMSTGILSVAKTFGVTMQSLGAAIATMTDQGVPAVDAATKIKSALISMASPIGATKKAFASIGLGTRDLADEMKSPQGIVGALSMLKQHMDAAGLDSVEQGQLIANAFGKRGGPAVMTLMNSLGLVALKEQQIGKAAGTFSKNVSEMMETTAFKASQVGASIGTIAVQIGTALLPMVNRFMDMVQGALNSNTLQQVFAGIGKAAAVAVYILGLLGDALGEIWRVLGDFGMQGPVLLAIVTTAMVALGVAAAGAAIAVISALWPIIAVIAGVAIAIKALQLIFDYFGIDVVDVFKFALGSILGIIKGFIGVSLEIAGGLISVFEIIPGAIGDAARAAHKTLDGMRADVDNWSVEMAAAGLQGAMGFGQATSANLDHYQNDLNAQMNTMGQGAGSQFGQGVGAGVLAAKGLTDQQMKDLGLSADGSLASGIDENGNLVGDATKHLVDKFGTSMRGVLAAAKTAGGAAMVDMAKGIDDARKAPLDAFNTLTTMLKHAMTPAAEELRLMGELMSKKLAQGMKSKDPEVRAQAIGTKQLIIDRLNELVTDGQPLGKKAMEMLRKGLKSKDKDIHAAAVNAQLLLVGPLNATAAKAGAAGTKAAQAFTRNFQNGIGTFSVKLDIKGSYTGGTSGTMKGFASGAWSIPKNMLAFIHQGEMIIPAAAAQRLRQDSSTPAFSALSGVGGGLTVNGGIHLHGVGSDVSPAAGVRFAQEVLTVAARGLQEQNARLSGARPAR